MSTALKAMYTEASANQLAREARVQAVTDRLSPAGEETRQETIDRIVNEKIKEMFRQPLTRAEWNNAHRALMAEGKQGWFNSAVADAICRQLDLGPDEQPNPQAPQGEERDA
jgi:hypothetical protein